MKAPSYDVLVNGKSILQDLNASLVSLVLVDNAGEKADTVSLNLSGKNIKEPPTGMVLRVFLGYGTELVFMGAFDVSALRTSFHPKSYAISGSSINFRTAMKSCRDMFFENTTLKEVAQTIANRYQLDLFVNEAIGSHKYPNLHQDWESDFSFLGNLVKQLDACLKMVDNKLIIVPKADGKSVSGKELSNIPLEARKLTNVNFDKNDRQLYSSVVCKYYDKNKAKTNIAQAGTDEPILALRETAQNKSEAQSKADKKFKQLQQTSKTLSFTTIGNANFKAESPFTISGFNQSPDGKWIAKKVTHNYQGSYTIEVQAVSV